MTSGRLIVASAPIGVLVAAVALLAPSDAASWYAKTAQPGLLIAASLLALWVSPMYRGDMRRIFLFLSAFLLLYGLVNVAPAVEWASDSLGANFLRTLLAYQIVAYAFLLAGCVLVVRVTGVRRLDVRGRLVVAVSVALGIVIVGFAVSTFREAFGDNTEASVLYLLIRVFDVLVMAMLVPVVWLYLQNARARYKESMSFAVIGGGIIASLVLVYLYELVKQQSLAEIAVAEFQQGSVLDALYLFGYFLLAVGLLAHRKHQEWSLRRVEELLQ